MLTDKESLEKAQNILTQYKQIADCTTSNSIRATYNNTAEWLSILIYNAEQNIKRKTEPRTKVKHGQWILKGAWHIECSECQHILAHIDEAKNFCPNCGIKMDGESTSD